MQNFRKNEKNNGPLPKYIEFQKTQEIVLWCNHPFPTSPSDLKSVHRCGQGELLKNFFFHNFSKNQDFFPKTKKIQVEFCRGETQQNVCNEIADGDYANGYDFI